MTTLIVIAKECVPGRVKTRLHPPFSLVQAAEIATACLADTLDVVDDLPATRRILYFDGTPPEWLPSGWEVVPQASGPLDERIAAIFDLADEPAVLIGMDTPHLDPGVLRPLFRTWPSDVDAWFGPATDGGFWALGMRDPDGGLVRGVAMSEPETGRDQEQRLIGAGLRVRRLPSLTDVDTVDDLAGALERSHRLARLLAGYSVQSRRIAS